MGHRGRGQLSTRRRSKLDRVVRSGPAAEAMPHASRPSPRGGGRPRHSTGSLRRGPAAGRHRPGRSRAPGVPRATSSPAASCPTNHRVRATDPADRCPGDRRAATADIVACSSTGCAGSSSKPTADTTTMRPGSTVHRALELGQWTSSSGGRQPAGSPPRASAAAARRPAHRARRRHRRRTRPAIRQCRDEAAGPRRRSTWRRFVFLFNLIHQPDIEQDSPGARLRARHRCRRGPLRATGGDAGLTARSRVSEGG